MDVAHSRFEIGSLSASPSFGTLIKCVGGQVKWAGAAGNKNVQNLQVGHCLQPSSA